MPDNGKIDRAEWERLVHGNGCPFDAPRADSNDDWDLVCPLTSSSLYLAKNQTYRGQCLLILDLRHAVHAAQLSAVEWGAFCSDLHTATRAVMRAVMPDHMNVASLGNVVPHLHWHIIPRYESDPRWGAPIWPTSLADMPDTRLSSQEQQTLIDKLREGLAL
jgi:diadenosine tetraphosphate (Ap4A) HIT family hydrolase